MYLTTILEGIKMNEAIKKDITDLLIKKNRWLRLCLKYRHDKRPQWSNVEYEIKECECDINILSRALQAIN